MDKNTTLKKEQLMKILLIDIDNLNRKGNHRFPNIALHKIAKYYQIQGAEIIWNNDLFCNIADKIFVSCVFGWNKEKAQQYEIYLQAVIGGSGYDINSHLPKEIEKVNPCINIGFTSRGCIRKCQFCIVPQKEGKFQATGDIYDIWDRKAKDITLLDNNILADKKHFFKICEQIKKRKLRVDFNQGLDCRLMDLDIAKCLKEMIHNKYRFSFDNVNEKTSVEKCITLLKQVEINDALWYVLVGYDSTFNEELERLNFLKSLNQRVFVQRYNLIYDKKYIVLAMWGNQHRFFMKSTFNEFLNLPRFRNYKKYFYE